MLGLAASLAGEHEDAVQGFQTALALHSEIGAWLGVRADWGYIGRHHLRNGRPKEALEAFQSSLDALPREGDPFEYNVSLRGQLEAFQKLNNVVGTLACLRLLVVLAGDLEEPYSNLLAETKQQLPDADYTALGKDLSENADSLRQSAVHEVLGDGDIGTSGG
jgi:tetratricopeptide (TPR) repeat protein